MTARFEPNNSSCRVVVDGARRDIATSVPNLGEAGSDCCCIKRTSEKHIAVSSVEKREGGEREEGRGEEGGGKMRGRRKGERKEREEGRGDGREMKSLFCTVPRRQDRVHRAQTLLAI